jgi:catechol 2,3-dioxygenase-like lactoylglutathione lyase family enzyme
MMREINRIIPEAYSMKSAVALTCLFLLASAITFGGQAAQSSTPQTLALVGYMMAVDSLEKGEEFYHHLLGLEAGADPRARLKWYKVVPFLTDMYRANENLRNFTLRIPGADMGVEPVQWNETKGRNVQPNVQDAGASQLVLTVNDIDELLMWLTRGGAKVVTAGGKPVATNKGNNKAREVVVRDLTGSYVRLVQPDPLPPGTGVNGAPSPSYVIGGNVAITVDNTERTARFYEDLLGVKVQFGQFMSDPAELAVLGMKGVQYRDSVVLFPGKSQLHLVEFKGAEGRRLTPGIIDPNAIVLRVQVRGIDALYAKLKAAGAPIMSLSGEPFQNGRTRWLMLRDPNNIYVQLTEQPQG